MACATPLVATTAGALPEVVGPGRRSPPCTSRPATPRRSPRPSPGCWTTPPCAARLGAAGRRSVVERYTWQAVAAQTAAWYRTTLEEKQC